MAKPKLALIPAAQGDKFYSVLPSDGVGDFDFTRNSSATRIAPTGFIQTVGAFGSELVTNGDFATDSDWSKGAGWTISGGKANYNGSANNGLIQYGIFNTGLVYRLTFDLVSNGGLFKFWVNGTQNIFSANLSTGSYTYDIVATTSGTAYFESSSSFTGSIDNVSVVQVVGNKSRLNYDLLNGKVVNCPHYLLEPASTNIIPYSEDFSNADWSKEDLTVSSNQTISPDGSLNADLLIPNTNNIDHTIYDQTSATTEVFTVFLKAGGYNYAFVGENNASDTDGAYFDLINGIVNKNTSSLSANIEDYGNGWFRCSLYGSFTYTFRLICPSENGQSFIFAGDGVKGIYSWGAQVEAGSYPTSYIPTNGTAITRAAETATGSGDAATFNDSEGVLMAEISALADDGSTRKITLNNGSFANQISISYNSSSNTIESLAYDGTAQAQLFYSPLKTTDFNKIAFKYKQNDFALWLNGIEVASTLLGSTTSFTLTTISFDNGDAVENFFGKTREVQYFDSALTDAQLETLTSWTSLQEMITSQLYTNY